MASKTFRETSRYDSVIAKWFNENKNKKIKLRYGENPRQTAYLISNTKKRSFFQISGKKISYNNIIDIDSGLKCISEFNEPTSIIIKHTNPCGVASSNNIKMLFVNRMTVTLKVHLRNNFK